ncbi:glutathione S-transferase [Breoghania sp. JC706]|uniref:glutathione S-transferase family protein n=1 Tax=Breoghania sp. JC706 TaxID=3117732 RepID=UPI003009BB60
MKLYDGGRAPNPRRVRVFLAEKGIDVPLEQVDIGKLEQKSEGFTSLNPYQRVPVLELDDGTVISETVAICRYFEETHPEPPLMGINAIDKAVVEMWQRRMEFNLLFPVAAVFRHLHPAMKEMEVPQVAAWGEANRPKAIEQMRFLDGELAHRAYIAGERFTIADITAMIALDFCKPAGIGIPEDLPNLARWRAAVKARPSAAA